MAPALEDLAFRSRPLFSLHEGAWPPGRLEREMKTGPAGRSGTIGWNRRGEGLARGRSLASFPPLINPLENPAGAPLDKLTLGIRGVPWSPDQLNSALPGISQFTQKVARHRAASCSARSFFQHHTARGMLD